MQWYGRKYFILTLALTAYLLIVPLFSAITLTSTLEELVFFVLLLTTLYVVAHNRVLLLLGVLLAAITFWGTLTTEDQSSLKFKIGLVSAFALLLIVIVIIIRDVIIDKNIVADTIFGAISAYLLIGVAWALIYLLADTFISQSLLIQVELPDSAVQVGNFDSFNLYNYFSFVTMTTLGYGDIIPPTR